MLACGSRLCHLDGTSVRRHLPRRFQCWPVEAGYVTWPPSCAAGRSCRHFSAGLWKQAMSPKMSTMIAGTVVIFQCWPVEAGYVTGGIRQAPGSRPTDFSAGLWKQAMSPLDFVDSLVQSDVISVLACGSRLCHSWSMTAISGRAAISVLACGSRLCHSTSFYAQI